MCLLSIMIDAMDVNQRTKMINDIRDICDELERKDLHGHA